MMFVRAIASLSLWERSGRTGAPASVLRAQGEGRVYSAETPTPHPPRKNRIALRSGARVPPSPTGRRTIARAFT